jgi:hypothetical protein
MEVKLHTITMAGTQPPPPTTSKKETPFISCTVYKESIMKIIFSTLRLEFYHLFVWEGWE